MDTFSPSPKPAPSNPSIQSPKVMVTSEQSSRSSPTPGQSSSTPHALEQPLRLIISGAPASGKGTQCQRIVERYGLVHISTGDMLREAVAQRTDLGLHAKQYMDSGALVPDNLVIAMLQERIEKDPRCRTQGWLLDGFPRTEVQARALDEAKLTPSAVIVLDVPDDLLIRRVVGRRQDPVTGTIYHLEYDPPTQSEVMSRLVQRSDDTEEKAVTRLQTFHSHAKSLDLHYEHIMARIDGNRSKNAVFEDIVDVVDAALSSQQQIDRTTVDAMPTASAVVATADTTTISTDTKRLDSARVQNSADPGRTGKLQSMPVEEFVRKAEEAYERGYLRTEDVNWSGQAGIDSDEYDRTQSYWDVFRRFDLALGDTLSFLIFAWVGRASHGNASLDGNVLSTALPFLTGWFLVAPLLGAYKRTATGNVTSALKAVLIAWSVAVPIGLGIRSVALHRLPPIPFVVVSLVSTLTVLSASRSAYVFMRGPETDNMRRGGFFDGIAMITTLLRRW